MKIRAVASKIGQAVSTSLFNNTVYPCDSKAGGQAVVCARAGADPPPQEFNDDLALWFDQAA